MTPYKVGYLIGSLAKGSINRKLARALAKLAPSEPEMSEIPFNNFQTCVEFAFLKLA